MDLAKSIFLAATIILLALGAWPIALITVTIFATLSVVLSSYQKKEHEALLNEIADIKRKIEQLEAERFIKNIVEQTENKRRTNGEQTENKQ